MSTKESEVTIRPLVGSDIDPILGFWWSDFIDNKEMVAAQIGGRHDLSFIASFEGHLIGFILARIVYLGIPIKEICIIHALAIEPNYQGKGIGTLLINKLKDTCEGRSIPTIRAFVAKDDLKLMNYFEGLGFQPSDIINMEQRCGGEAEGKA